MRQNMAAQEETGVKPVFNKDEGWKAAQHHKKKLIAKSNRTDDKGTVEAPSRRPTPLPFGKIDIFV